MYMMIANLCVFIFMVCTSNMNIFTNGSYLLNSPKIKDMCPNLIQLADREEDIYTGKQK